MVSKFGGRFERAPSKGPTVEELMTLKRSGPKVPPKPPKDWRNDPKTMRRNLRIDEMYDPSKDNK